MPGKERFIDVLISRYPAESTDELYAAVMCGEFRIDGHTVKDPSQFVSPDGLISRNRKNFVSRGGMKLDHVLTQWNIDVSGLGFVDAGSSTGGFTDCLLQRGAGFVHAVDVGYNQLDWKIRSDTRVIVHERTNIMDISTLDPVPDVAVADLSFRSLRRAARHILTLTKGKWCIALIKPQFEMGAHPSDSFDGVIREREVFIRVVSDLFNDLKEEGVYTAGVLRSPLAGRKGNIEVLALLQEEEIPLPDDITALFP